MQCPNCQEELHHFSGVEGMPEHWFCPNCFDYAYDEEGNIIARLE